jgi:hypothetical protein
MGTQNIIKRYQNCIYQFRDKEEVLAKTHGSANNTLGPYGRLYLVSGISPENISGHGNKEQEVSTSGCSDKVMDCTWFHSWQR